MSVAVALALGIVSFITVPGYIVHDLLHSADVGAYVMSSKYNRTVFTLMFRMSILFCVVVALLFRRMIRRRNVVLAAVVMWISGTLFVAVDHVWVLVATFVVFTVSGFIVWLTVHRLCAVADIDDIPYNCGVALGACVWFGSSFLGGYAVVLATAIVLVYAVMYDAVYRTDCVLGALMGYRHQCSDLNDRLRLLGGTTVLRVCSDAVFPSAAICILACVLKNSTSSSLAVVVFIAQIRVTGGCGGFVTGGLLLLCMASLILDWCLGVSLLSAIGNVAFGAASCSIRSRVMYRLEHQDFFMGDTICLCMMLFMLPYACMHART